MLNYVVPLVGLTIFAQDGTKPSALLAMEQNRRALHAARIHWSTTYRQHGGRFGEMTFVSRYAANGDYIFEQRGDQDGWTIRAGKRGISKMPQLYMVNQRGFWYYQETGGRATVWEDKADVFARSRDVLTAVPYLRDIKDIRYVGISTAAPDFMTGTDPIWGGEDADAHTHVWEQSLQDGLYKVVRRDKDGSALTWFINPDRGWNPERIIQTSPAGAKIFEILCSLKQYGKVWFPESTAFYHGPNLVSLTTIQSASFNDPAAPKQFEPAHLGIDAGINIKIHRRDGESSELLIWDGEKMVAVPEWIRMLKSGEKRVGPTIALIASGKRNPYETQEAYEERGAQMAAARREIALTWYQDYWTKYVREFIARFALNQPQSEKAWQIYGDCTKQADAYVSRRKQEILKASELFAEARGAGDETRISKAREKIRALKKPIRTIAAKQLEPRLDKLPTRAQRAAAEKSGQRKVSAKRKSDSGGRP